MERFDIALSAEKYDQTVRGGLDALPVLPEGGDLSAFVKPNATLAGNAMVVLTFTVRLPDGSVARAQAATTAALLEAAGIAIRGWREGGHL